MVARYFPILKGKRGEFAALERVAPALYAAVRPVIEIVPSSQGRRVPLTPAQHLSETVDRTFAAWGTNPIGVDLHLSGLPDARGAAHPWAIAATHALRTGLALIPAVTPDDSPAGLGAAASTAAVCGNGAMIRLPWTTCAQLTAGQVDAELARVRRALSLQRRDIDLLIDQREMPTTALRRSAALTNVLDPMPHLGRWRSVVCVGTSFPPDISRVPFGTTLFKRIEWLVWQDLLATTRSRPTARRWPSIAFGDYAAAAVPLPPGAGRTRHPALRYTDGEDVVVLRHQAAPGDDLSGFRDLCVAVVDPRQPPTFAGESFSWGDLAIERIARGVDTHGNGETWRRIATSHHVATVATQLAATPWP